MGVATADELSRQKEQLMRTEQVNLRVLVSESNIISGSSRMPTYRTFQYLEEYIVSSLQYRVYSINLEKAEPRSEEGVHTAMCDNIDTRRVLETLERRCEGHGKTGGFDRDLENILDALKPFFAGQGN